MAKDNKKKNEPTCGCGRPDLYEELLKQQKNSKDNDTGTSCESRELKESEKA